MVRFVLLQRLFLFCKTLTSHVNIPSISPYQVHRLECSSIPVSCIVALCVNSLASMATLTLPFSRQQRRCKQNCDGPAPCGGIRQWVTLHDTPEACCDAHLYWLVQQNGSYDGCSSLPATTEPPTTPPPTSSVSESAVGTVDAFHLFFRQ